MANYGDYYKLGLYEKAFPTGLCFDQMLDETHIFGFDWLEISIDETDYRLKRLYWSNLEKQQLTNTVKQSGVPIRTMCLSGHRKYPLGSHDARIRELSLEIMKRAIDFASYVGISVIQLAGYDVYNEDHDESTQGYFVENLSKAVALAATSGVILAFETMETPFMDTVHKAMRYVQHINSPWLGVYPDIGNLQNAADLYNSDIIEDLAAGTGHIFAIHLKETLPGVYRNLTFGTGHTNYIACLEFAAASNIRMFTGEFWHKEGEDHTTVIPHSAAFLREKLNSVFIV